MNRYEDVHAMSPEERWSIVVPSALQMKDAPDRTVRGLLSIARFTEVERKLMIPLFKNILRKVREFPEAQQEIFFEAIRDATFGERKKQKNPKMTSYGTPVYFGKSPLTYPTHVTRDERSIRITHDSYAPGAVLEFVKGGKYGCKALAFGLPLGVEFRPELFSRLDTIFMESRYYPQTWAPPAAVPSLA